MARIIRFHYNEPSPLGKVSRKDREDMLKRLRDILKDYPNVKFKGTYLDDNGIGTCEWDAPNTEVVKEITEKLRGSPPADLVIMVKKVL